MPKPVLIITDIIEPVSEQSLHFAVSPPPDSDIVELAAAKMNSYQDDRETLELGQRENSHILRLTGKRLSRNTMLIFKFVMDQLQQEYEAKMERIKTGGSLSLLDFYRQSAGLDVGPPGSRRDA